MSLAELRLEEMRCLRSATLELDPRLNLITGGNGAGKTSILEAIYLLGRGRSFRTRHTEQLIRYGQPKLWVFGRVACSSLIPETQVSHVIGLSYHRREGVEARIDGTAITSLAQLSTLFPVQVIDPGIHRLVEEGPLHRRRWLDWAVFHVEPNFIQHWQSYSRALRQRNAALRSNSDPTLWDGELARLGELLTASRARLIDSLQPYWIAVLGDLNAEPATLSFYPGWSREQTLSAALGAHLLKDRERGSTVSGPHRFDVALKLDQHSVREVVSRGQQKLLGAAMALTMSRYLSDVTGHTPTLLLDDPAAELDQPHTESMLSAVRKLGGQLVVTALRVGDTPLGAPNRVFHVEQGVVKRL
jgi:DNA replication and repair protein RecF